jgi:hypothetical protein
MTSDFETTKNTLALEIRRLEGELVTLKAALAYFELAAPTAATTPVIAEVQSTPAPEARVPTVVLEDSASIKTAQVLTIVPARSPAAVHATLDSESDSVDNAQKLKEEIQAWHPKLNREPLEQLYFACNLARPRNRPELPSVLDLTCPEIRRHLENYLRHHRVEGYRDFCGRLQAFQHLGFLYKLARDKATACISQTYPELSNYESAAETPCMPSGATQFAKLAGLVTTSATKAA